MFVVQPRHLVLLVLGLALVGVWGWGGTGSQVAEPPLAPAESVKVEVPALPSAVNAAPRNEVSSVARSAIAGVVTRLGAPVPRRAVAIRGRSLRGDALHTAVETDVEGRYHVEVPAGRYVVAVPFVEVEVRPIRTLTMGPFAQHLPDAFDSVSVEVDVGAAPIACDLALPGGLVHVAVHDATTARLVGPSSLRVRCPDLARLVEVVAAAPDGVCTLRDLPAAVFTIEATARGYRGGSAGFEVTASTPHASVSITVEPTCALDVRMIGPDGEALEISAATRLEVVNVASGELVTPSNRGDLHGPTRPRALRFDDIAAGDYRVSLADEVIDEGEERVLRFQPIDATAPVVAVTVPGEVVTADLNVRYRCYALLRGHDLEGGFDPAVTLRVERTDAPVKTSVLPAPWQTGSRHGTAHFDGYLAPGSYLLTFTHPSGRTVCERLFVGREPIDRSIALRW